MDNLFNSLGNNKPRQNPMQMVQELKSDPGNFLKNMGFNIPNGVDINNPQSIINGLLQSGQVGNNRYIQAMQRAKSLFGR